MHPVNSLKAAAFRWFVCDATESSWDRQGKGQALTPQKQDEENRFQCPREEITAKEGHLPLKVVKFFHYYEALKGILQKLSVEYELVI